MTKIFRLIWINLQTYSLHFNSTACLTLVLGMQCLFCVAQNNTAVENNVNEIVEQTYNDYFFTHPDSAFARFNEAAHLAHQAQRWDLKISALLQIAWCADYHTLIDTLQQYLYYTEELLNEHAIALDTLDPEGLVATDVAYTRGVFYYTTGDFGSAIEAFNEIVQPRTLAQITDSLLVADVFSYLGSAYYRLQNYQKALDHYQVADQWLPLNTDAQDYDRSYRQALNALYQAQSHYALGKYSEKDDAYLLGKVLVHQAFDFLLPRKSTPRFQNPVLSGANVLAAIFQEQQQYDSAIYYLEFVLPLQDKHTAKVIDTHNKLGATYALMHQYEEALKHYQQSMKIANRVLPAKHYQRGTIYTLIGQVQAEQGDWNKAIESYQHALGQFVTEFTSQNNLLENPAYQDSGAKKELLEVLSYKAEALWQLYQQHPDDLAPLSSALEIYHQIGDILNTMRRVFPSIEYKQFIASRFFSIYEQAIRVAFEMHQREEGASSRQYLAEAFHFAEKSKSILLLEATLENQARDFAGISPILLEEERELTRKRSFLEQQLSELDDQSSGEASAIRQQVLATQDAYQELMRQLEQEFPEYYRLKHDTEVATLSKVQSTLPPGTVLLSYFYGDSTLFAFGIGSETAFVHPIAIQDSLPDQIIRLITNSSQYQWQTANSSQAMAQFIKDGTSIYHELVGTVLDSLEDQPEKLIIIPDGQLGYLPFDVLLTDTVHPASSPRYADLPYLLKRYPIRYEYSATLYTHQTSPSQAIKSQYAYTGFAPVYEGNSPLLAENELTRSMRSDLSFSNLLYNKEEVEQASQLFKSKVFVDKQATEQAFKEYAIQSDILHLSMHAFAHDSEPKYSGLVFTQPATADEDNFLYAYELYNMKLQANLAILSACETGIGKLARGEGIMSLGRAFKYAGCPNVAMSLWKVNDRTTQHIVQSFFEQLAKGNDKDEALQQAKLSFLANAKGPLTHPYYWASLVLIGDDAPINDESANLFWIYGSILGVLVLLAAIFWLRYYRKG